MWVGVDYNSTKRNLIHRVAMSILVLNLRKVLWLFLIGGYLQQDKRIIKNRPLVQQALDRYD
jgi:hypothetical protein